MRKRTRQVRIEANKTCRVTPIYTLVNLNSELKGEKNCEPAGEPNGEPSGEPYGEPNGEQSSETTMHRNPFEKLFNEEPLHLYMESITTE